MLDSYMEGSRSVTLNKVSFPKRPEEEETHLTGNNRTTCTSIRVCGTVSSMLSDLETRFLGLNTLGTT